jgi:hypothetical protein
MEYRLMKLGRVRYVGDSSTKHVHDRWHPDSQGCGVREIVERGHAVGFEPDTLDGALLAGYEYCEGCHDRTEPRPPEWASSAEPSEEHRDDRGTGPPESVPTERSEVVHTRVMSARR